MILTILLLGAVTECHCINCQIGNLTLEDFLHKQEVLSLSDAWHAEMAGSVLGASAGLAAKIICRPLQAPGPEGKTRVQHNLGLALEPGLESWGFIIITFKAH
jgi:hypothetical protein